VVLIKYVIAVEAVPSPAYDAGYSPSLVNGVLVWVVLSAGVISSLLAGKGLFIAMGEAYHTPKSQKQIDRKQEKVAMGKVGQRHLTKLVI
jgi:hypothetical protein